MKVGFIGLGTMGEPMASNMARAGTQLVVWNRSARASDHLRSLGAVVADSPKDVFDDATIVFLMLANGDAIDAVLRRGTSDFDEMVAGHTLVHMGTTEPAYSLDLANDTARAGGRYVEVPVSGSRRPAEAGHLVGMAAGPTEAVDQVLPILAPVCSSIVRCGEVPKATQMKLAVNLFLVTQVAGLVEAFHFAEHNDLDLDKFQAVIDAGPLASAVSRMKLEKLVNGDFTVQAAIADVFYNCDLIAEAARQTEVAAPLLRASRHMYGEAVRLGHGDKDMAAVLKAFEAQTDRQSKSLGL